MNDIQRKNIIAIAKEDSPELRLLSGLSDSAEITLGNSFEELKDAAPSADLILFWEPNVELLKQLLPICPSVTWLHHKSAGLEPLMFKEFVESDITLTNARGVYARSLAEWAITGMLYFAKDIPRLLANKENNNWEQFKVEELIGKTLGIFGYGAIGRKCAEKAKAFDMKVIAYRRNPEKSKGDPLVDEVVSGDELSRLYQESDYVLCAAPNTPETKHAIGKEQFALMKPSSVFINIGRGSVVDEVALIETLKSNSIKGAALDVFETEPLPKESPLWDLPNVFISPHSADQTATWLEESMELFLENFQRHVKGEELLNISNKDLGY